MKECYNEFCTQFVNLDEKDQFQRKKKEEEKKKFYETERLNDHRTTKQPNFLKIYLYMSVSACTNACIPHKSN